MPGATNGSQAFAEKLRLVGFRKSAVGSPVMPDVIVSATTAEDYAAFAAMIQECVEWSRERDAGASWFVDAVFSHQSLDEELRALKRRGRCVSYLTVLAGWRRRNRGGARGQGA